MPDALLEAFKKTPDPSNNAMTPTLEIDHDHVTMFHAGCGYHHKAARTSTLFVGGTSRDGRDADTIHVGYQRRIPNERKKERKKEKP